MGKKEVKLSLFADGIILYRENPKEYFKKILELVCEFSKVAEHKSNVQNWLCFYIISVNKTKMILGNKTNSIYHSTHKKIGIDCESRNNPHIYGQVDFWKRC